MEGVRGRDLRIRHLTVCRCEPTGPARGRAQGCPYSNLAPSLTVPRLRGREGWGNCFVAPLFLTSEVVYRSGSIAIGASSKRRPLLCSPASIASVHLPD